MIFGGRSNQQFEGRVCLTSSVARRGSPSGHSPATALSSDVAVAGHFLKSGKREN
jgi:hypothetical protein